MHGPPPGLYIQTRMWCIRLDFLTGSHRLAIQLQSDTVDTSIILCGRTRLDSGWLKEYTCTRIVRTLCIHTYYRFIQQLATSK